MPKCSICGREVNAANIAYIKGDFFVCGECFPSFYVRQLCTLTQRRLRGESPTPCIYCKFKRICDEYISRTLKSLSS